MDNRLFLAGNPRPENPKSRTSNAKKSKRKRFTRVKRRGVRNKLHKQHSEDSVTTRKSDEQNSVELTGTGPFSDESDNGSCDYGADILNMSPVGSVPLNDEDRKGIVMSVDNNYVLPSTAWGNNAIKGIEDDSKSFQDDNFSSHEEETTTSSITIDSNLPSSCLAYKIEPCKSITASEDEECEFPQDVVVKASEVIERCDVAGTEPLPNERLFQPTAAKVPPIIPSFPGIHRVPFQPLGQSGIPILMTTLLEEVIRRLRVSLPSLWLPIIKNDGIHVGLCAESATFIVQRSMYVIPEGSVACTVHGNDLPTLHPFWKNVKKVSLCPDSVEEFAKNVLHIVLLLATFETCPGVEQYQHLWKCAANCWIDYNSFHEKKYNTTCRSDLCSLLYQRGNKKSRCEFCTGLSKIFYHREKRRSKKGTESPAKNAPTCYLSTSEQQMRLSLKNAQLKSERQRNIRLTEKIAALLAKDKG